MLLREFGSLLATVCALYAALLATYIITCLIVTRLNRRAVKIQPFRRTPVSQVRRDLRQSAFSLAVIAAMFGGGHWTYMELGWGLRPLPGIGGTAISIIASLALFDTWFYWFHRLIHTRLFYRRVHRWHHLTIAPVVWSNNSDRLVDNLFLQSYWFVVHMLIPIAPAVLFAHKIYDQITGVIGHSGHEHAGRWCWPPSPLAGVTHHDQHHQYFRCNYATHFTLWDRVMGTLHPDHDGELKANIEGSHRPPTPTWRGAFHTEPGPHLEKRQHTEVEHEHTKMVGVPIGADWDPDGDEEGRTSSTSSSIFGG